MNKNDYFILGYGKFGRRVTQTLIEKNNNVIVLDNNKEVIDKAPDTVSCAMCIDTTDINALKETGILNATCIIVAISDVQDSILTCANLVELGVKGNIIARAQNTMHKRVLKTIGIEHVAVPEEEVAHRVGLQAMYHFDESVHSLTADYVWVSLVVSNRNCTNQPLKDLNIRGKINASILFIKHNGENIFPVKSNTTLSLGDLVVIMASEKTLGLAIDFFTDSMFRSVNKEQEHENTPLVPQTKRRLRKIQIKLKKKTKNG